MRPCPPEELEDDVPKWRPRTWWYVYMYVWLGLMVSWMLWLLPGLDGWKLAVSVALTAVNLLCMVQIERDRRRRSRAETGAETGSRPGVSR